MENNPTHSYQIKKLESKYGLQNLRIISDHSKEQKSIQNKLETKKQQN